MAAGHSTTTIPRPKRPPKRTRTASKRRDSTVHDLTRPIPVDRRLVTGRAKRRTIAIGTVAVLTALAAALFVLPVQSWVRLSGDIERRERELSALERANGILGDEVERLQTPEGIEEAAREEIGYVPRGEVRLTVLPFPDAPTSLPSGWPYDAAAQIISLRSTSAPTP